MGAFQKKFSDDQRDAFVHAVLDAGYTQRHARQLARDGELGDVPPFNVSEARGYEWVQAERLRRAAEDVKGTPELSAVLLDQARRLTVINERKIRKLEALDRAGRDVPLSSVKGCATVVRTLAFAQPRRVKPNDTPSKPEPETQEPTLLTRLAQDATATTTPTAEDNRPNGDTPKGGTDSRFVSPPEPSVRARTRLTAAE